MIGPTATPVTQGAKLVSRTLGFLAMNPVATMMCGTPCCSAQASSLALDRSYWTSTELPSDVGVTTCQHHEI